MVRVGGDMACNAGYRGLLDFRSGITGEADDLILVSRGALEIALSALHGSMGDQELTEAINVLWSDAWSQPEDAGAYEVDFEPEGGVIV